jgi:hypothetical protein
MKDNKRREKGDGIKLTKDGRNLEELEESRVVYPQ